MKCRAHPERDGFSTASTLRQLTAVWELGEGPGTASAILALLRAALLDAEPGQGRAFVPTYGMKRPWSAPPRWRRTRPWPRRSSTTRPGSASPG